MLGKTVYELKNIMPTSELRGWVKYLNLEPRNSVEMQLALLAQMTNNVNGGKATFDEMLFTAHKKENDTEDIVDSRPSDEAIKLAFGVFKK